MAKEQTSTSATVQAVAAMRAMSNRYGLLAYRVPDVLLAGWAQLTEDQRAAAIMGRVSIETEQPTDG